MTQRQGLTAAAIAVAAAVLFFGAACAEQATRGKEQPTMPFPQAVIANDSLKLTVYLPDPDRGFYRAVRFDRSGLIARAEFAGHTAYGPFQPKYDALASDNVVGPAEEFDMDSPPGYAEAKVGGTFVKIGVGVLEKPEESKYDFFKSYKIVRLPAWKVTSGKDWIEFRQNLTEGGWGYEYTKRIAVFTDLAKNVSGSGFTISHTLKNTGKKAIDTLVYCHNFTILDDDPVGPDYRITFPTPLEMAANGRVGPGVFKDSTMTFPHVLKDKEPQWCQFVGIKGTVEENGFTIANSKRGVALKVKGDRPPEMMRFFATATAACPEPFVRIQVAPGESRSWSSTYTFTVK